MTPKAGPIDAPGAAVPGRPRQAPGTVAPGVPRRARMPRLALHGVLLLDKPLGLSSNDALQKAKRLLRAEKAGHTGTLDPLATGLLPLCLGAATKFAQVSLEADKRYIATLKLGERTASGDRESPVTERTALPAQAQLQARLAAVLPRFLGRIAQRPPMHSALKHQGRALYDYARAGVEVERPAREVVVHAIEPLEWQGDTLVLDVRCGKGTYIRALADELGQALGVGAHLAALRRTASGGLTLAGAVTLAELEAMTEAERWQRLQPVASLLAERPAIRLSAAEAARFLTGLRRRLGAPSEVADQPAVRVMGPHPQRPGTEVLLGSGHVKAGELIADRLLSPAEVSGCAQAAWLLPARPPDAPLALAAA